MKNFDKKKFTATVSKFCLLFYQMLAEGDATFAIQISGIAAFQ